MIRLHTLQLRVTSLLLLLAAGCGGEDFDSARWGGTIETLASGVIRVVNPAEGLWEVGEPWRLLPELVLGEIEGAEAEVFASISGLAVDDAGRIYVLDRQANELRIFSPEGGHIRSVGRPGEGPGEYASANGLAWLAPDTLVVIDQRGNRYSVLTSDGEYVRSVPRRLGFYGWVYRGGHRDGWIYESTSVSVGEDRYPALLGTSMRGSGADSSAAADDGRLVASSARDTVMLPRPNATPYESFSVRTERGGMTMSVPFAASSVYHLDGTGSIWHGHGGDFRIYRSSFEGDTISEFVIEAEPAPVTSTELAEWEAGRAVEQFRSMGGKLDIGRIPKVKPFFDDIYVDPDGNVWLSVPVGPTETVFAILDPDGRYLGRLQLDGIDRDIYIPPVVRNGRLYLVATDELDVQRVYAFRIER